MATALSPLYEKIVTSQLLWAESSSPPDGDSDDDGLIVGIVVIVIALVIVAIVICAIVIVCKRRRARSKRRANDPELANSTQDRTKASLSPTIEAFTIIPNKSLQSLEVIGKGYFGEVRKGNWQGVQGSSITPKILDVFCNLFLMSQLL